ncbi:MAG: M15 family metallopeptidase [Patescibacteria group bacterium]
MAQSTLPDSQKEDEADRIQKHYDESMGSGNITHGLDQLESFANDPANHDKQDATAQSLGNAESQAGGAPKAGDDIRDDESSPGGWKNNYSSDGKRLDDLNVPKLNKALSFAKKRGGILGLIAVLGVSGGLLAAFFGPATMLINLMENASITNDSSSTVLERRFLKVLGFSTKPTDPICAQKPNNLKCSKGRISNSALDKLAAKGVVPIFADEVDTNERKKTGYPTKNPVAYQIGDTPVQAANLEQHLRDNPKDAAKVLGRTGAFHLKVSNWGGKQITKNFYKRFALEKDGGIADGKNENLTSKERLAASLERLRADLPGTEDLGTAADGASKKVTDVLDKAKRGGTVYMLSVAGCVAVKAPSYIAAAVAAVQMAQVLPIGMDLVLSPGAKAKASGVETDYAMTESDMNAAGTIMTSTSPRESDGKMTSFTDSQILQSSIGVNKGKPAVSADYTPGYSILTNPAVIASRDMAEASEPACNIIMSPAAMWSAFAVDSAVTVIASSTIVGGVVKVLSALLIGEVAGQVAGKVVGEAARTAIGELAQNDKISKAQGEALGDVAGIAIMSFFSAGSAARHLPVMKMSQMAAYNDIKQENENFQRDMDIATLSPLDTSSRYTALGSVVHSMQTAVMTNGIYNGSFSSILTSLARLPSLAFSSNAGAANYTDEYCGYAADFGLDAGSDTPCITAAGTPGYGLTPEQDGMTTDEGFTEIEEWLDEDKPLKDTASTDELLASGYIKADTPIADNMNACSDLSKGDYIYNAASCAVASDSEAQNTDQTAEVSPASQRELAAINVALIDYQDSQILNGNDVIADESTTTSVAGATIDMDALFKDSTSIGCAPGTTEIRNDMGYNGGVEIPVKLCAMPNTYETDPRKGGAPGTVNSVASGAAYAMFEEMRIFLKVDRIGLNDSFRTYAEQEEAKRVYGSGAADPGYSNHQLGAAFDINMGYINGGNSSSYSANVNTSYPGNPVWEWLNANAGKYGFKQLSWEGWHWSATGQ